MTETGARKKTTALLAAALLISCVFIFWRFIFGDYVLAYTDVGVDTYDQYLICLLYTSPSPRDTR